MTFFGLSTLNYAELHELLDPLNGYISRTPIISQPKNNKKTLVLDVDGTILFATRWIVDIRMGDVFFETTDDVKSPWTLTGFTVAVKHPDGNVEVVVVHSQLEMDGLCAMSDCAIEIAAAHLSTAEQTKEIPASQFAMFFEPCLDTVERLCEYNARRPELTPMTYVSDGLVVRFRPFLPAFLCQIRKEYNVILFTAAKKKGYRKLLKRAEKYLKPMIGDKKKRVFGKVLFRESCDQVANHQYRKDIGKLGVDLSQLVMVDDTRISFEGFEPNAIQIKSFFGEVHDKELAGLMTCLLSMSATRDVRYTLCGIKDDDDDMSEDEAANMCSLEKTAQFLFDLRAKYFGTNVEQENKDGNEEDVIREPIG